MTVSLSDFAPSLADFAPSLGDVHAMTEAEIERLAVLIEELGEAQQAAGKILRHGYDSYHPETYITNRCALESEMGDVLAALSILVSSGDIRSNAVETNRNEKLRRISKYLHHQTVTTIDVAKKWMIEGF
jgi:NTP pyrophosphatase (non-canonical NTP hydrolase)